MSFVKLFDIIYTDSETKYKYESIVNNIKVQPFLRFNKNTCDQFTIIISKNISYNKSYNKLKLEFHNINKNTINNDLVMNVLNKIQNIIISNSNLDNDEVLENEDELESDMDSELDEVLENEDELESDMDSELNITPELEEAIKLVVSKQEYLQLHLFQKKYTENGYDKSQLKYVSSFQLNNKIKIQEKFDINHDNFGDFDITYDEELNLNAHIYNNTLPINYISDLNYYNKFFKTFSYYGGDDYDLIQEYLQDFDVCDSYLLTNINKIMSGYYVNHNDVSLQLIIKLIMLSLIGNYGKTHKMITYKNYTKENTFTNYFEYNKDYTMNIYDNLLLTNLNTVCDNCDIHLLDTNYYHNDIGGDLCSKCFSIKKNDFYKRINYLKNRILKIGKIEVFKKDVMKTRKLLGKKKYKLKKKPYYKLLETINKNLLNINSTQTVCKICYQSLKTDIYVGSECGHCFHKSCLDMCNSNGCQICRVDTKFVRLFL